MASITHIRASLAVLVLAIAVASGLPLAAQETRGVIIELKASERRDAPVVERVQLYPRSYALVIGNDDYQDPFWVKLSNGVRDAREVAAALEAKGFDVTLRQNLDGDALEEALESFFYERGLDFDARLFVWYAGHGHTEAGEGYLVPVDAPDPDDAATFRRRALSLRRMGEYARGANAHHILAVFDSCFAGTVFEVQRDAPPAAITHATTRPVRQFITSGDAGQTVSDDGTFRRIFIEAIGGQRRADLNRDGYVTASELGLFLSDSITNYTEGSQTPRYGKLRDPNWDQGDFVFSLAALPSPQKQSTPAQTAAGVAADPCQIVWRGIADSRQAADFEAFLATYPDCLMAPIARARLGALTQETQVAARTPPAQPSFTVEDRDETLVALKNANVRGKPTTDGKKVTTLRQGTKVAVTGSVKDRDWLRVALKDGETGFIWAPLLGEKPAEVEAPKQPETKVAVGVYPERRTPGTAFRDCDDCPEMVVLPADSFMMGSTEAERSWAQGQGAKAEWLTDETPQHRVAIAAPFAVGKYEVTRAEFATFAAATGHRSQGSCYVLTGGRWKKQSDKSWNDPGFAQSDREPAVCISWDDAKAYVAWLSRRTGQSYRLLSEAEWEYAARAGSTTFRYWGDDRENREGCAYANVANMEHNWKHAFDCEDGYKTTSPVGRYRANDFGLHDMLGNVWEWTEDCYHDSYAGAPAKGSAWTTGSCDRRVLRGGSWNNSPGDLRSADRLRFTPGNRGSDFGFRVSRTLSR